MPPKNQPSKKSLDKQVKKVVEDKTFGLKNKNKSAKVQKYVATVKKTVDEGLKKKLPKPMPGEAPKKSKAELEAEKKAELASLFKVTQARVPAGADPKSILCEFFKQGLCQKGDKCKFSHDMLVARKGAKIDIYTDKRETPKEGEKADDMESGNWTQDMLEKVVKEREEKAGIRCASDIICKFFLDAVESRKYGWFWACPNGGEKCQYRHALPPGYVLKSEKKKDDEEKPEEVPIEELIEEERKKLTTRTPMTKDLFLKWKEERTKRKKAAAEEEEKARKEALKTGKTQMSGREMFEFHPEYFVDDDEAFGADDYIKAEPDESMPETVLTVTGTSIVATQKNGGKPLQPIHIQDESLFNDADMALPDDDDDDGDGKPLDGANGGGDDEEEEDGDAEEEEEEEDDKPEKPEKEK